MRKTCLILLVALFPLLAICQKKKGKTIDEKVADPFAFAVSGTPGFTKLSPAYTSLYSYDVNAYFGYFFTDNMWASAGLGYSHKSFKQDLSKVTSLSPPKVTSSLDYFEFPVTMHYRTGNFNQVTHEEKKHKGHKAKIGFTASAGIIPGIIWDGKYNYSGSDGHDHQASRVVLKNEGYKSIVSVSGSVGIYYHLTHYVFMTVEPEYKYCISKIPRGVNYHWSSIGFKVSFWFRILPEFGV